MFEIDVQAFIASLEYIGKGYAGIFAVTAVIVLIVWMFNTIPEKVYESERKKEEKRKAKESK